MKIFSELNSINTNQLISDNCIAVGLDVGDKTIGVAISDRRIKISSGVTTISRNGSSQDCIKLKSILEKYAVGCIVFGWPVQMNGIPGSQCEKVLKFAEGLRNYFDIPFVYWDERLSTRAVDNVMIQADISRKKRKKVVDKNAAVYILQGTIDFLNRNQKNTNSIKEFSLQ